MTRKIALISLSALFLMLVVAGPSLLWADARNDRIKELSNQIRLAQRRIKDNESLVKQFADQYVELEKATSQAQQELDAAKRDVDHAVARFKDVAHSEVPQEVPAADDPQLRELMDERSKAREAWDKKIKPVMAALAREAGYREAFAALTAAQKHLRLMQEQRDDGGEVQPVVDAHEAVKQAQKVVVDLEREALDKDPEIVAARRELERTEKALAAYRAETTPAVELKEEDPAVKDARRSLYEARKVHQQAMRQLSKVERECHAVQREGREREKAIRDDKQLVEQKQRELENVRMK